MISATLNMETKAYVRAIKGRTKDPASRATYQAWKENKRLMWSLFLDHMNRNELDPIPSKEPFFLSVEFGISRLWMPDTDNLVKTVLDALNGIAYEDDRYCQSIQARKVKGEHTKIVIGRMNELPDALQLQLNPTHRPTAYLYTDVYQSYGLTGDKPRRRYALRLLSMLGYMGPNIVWGGNEFVLLRPLPSSLEEVEREWAETFNTYTVDVILLDMLAGLGGILEELQQWLRRTVDFAPAYDRGSIRHCADYIQSAMEHLKRASRLPPKVGSVVVLQVDPTDPRIAYQEYRGDIGKTTIMVQSIQKLEQILNVVGEGELANNIRKAAFNLKQAKIPMNGSEYIRR